ncbi:MAG TPA: radical SAM protein [Nannocystaceae bacterium]|nr:radical SAM protein [Nannocystaceae bacterium]
MESLPQLRAETLDIGLVLTHACNLACTYCYTGEKKRVRMPEAVAMRAVELAIDEAARNGVKLQLSFFGGEPLLEHELVLAVAHRARAHGHPLVMQLTTNGTLLTEALVEQLGALGVHLAISIDGTRAQQDAVRPLAGGGSSYDTTRRGLELLLAQRERFPFDVIAVIDPTTVHRLGDGVRELLDLGVDALTLNTNFGGRWDDAQLDALDQQLELVAATMLAWLRRGRWVRIQPLESALRSFAQLGRVTTMSCNAGARRLAVAPSGRIYGCSRAVGEDTGRFALGHLDQGLPAPRAVASGCACASAEETGDPRVAGPVQLRHDRSLARVAERLAARIGSEYELIHVVERGHTP